METICFTGHHGTSSENANKIRNGNFICKKGWFGTGAYFFDDDRELAREWAKFRYRKERVEVIECDIKVKKNNLLDLCNPKSQNNKNFHLFRKMMLSRGVNIVDLNEATHDLDCKVIDYLIKKDNLDVVRNASYTYTKEDRENKKIGSNVTNGFEICVANLSCIESKK